MIVDIHKPDTSTLVTTGHFYFGWTADVRATDLSLGLCYSPRAVGVGAVDLSDAALPGYFWFTPSLPLASRVSSAPILILHTRSRFA